MTGGHEETITQTDDGLNHDADQHAFAYFSAKPREYLKSVLSDEIIDEYCRSPLGWHSEPLERLLAHFRRLPLGQQYALRRGTDGGFRMVALSGRRGVRPCDVGPDVFATIEQGYIGIFLKQINDMMDT